MAKTQMTKTAKAKFPTSIVFMVLVAAFGTWVYFSEFKGADERAKAKSEAAALVPFSNSSIVAVTLKTSEGPSESRETVLKKDGETWKVEKPFSDLGDRAAIESFLSSLSTERSRETVLEANDIAWKTFGLDQPAAEVTLLAKTDQGDKKRVIELGSTPAFDGSLYGRVDGENRVLLLNAGLKMTLQKDAGEFRDKRFFSSEKHPEFNSIEIAHAGRPKTILSLKDGKWSFTGRNEAWPLDQGVVASYVQAVSGLRGNDVWAEDKRDVKVIRDRKLAASKLTVTLRGEKGASYEVRIAQPMKDQTVSAGVSSEKPLVFSVYKAQVDLLDKSEDDFRDLGYPFQFALDDIRAIELERPKTEPALPLFLRKDGKWVVDPVDVKHQGREARAISVDAFLTGLKDLRATKILSKAPTPKLGVPGSLRVGLFGDKNKKIAELVFSPIGEKVNVSSYVAPGRVFEIDKARFEALPLELLEPEQANAPSPTPKGSP